MIQADRSQRGFLSFSAIVALAIFGSLIFLALKLVPPYVNNYQLQDSIENLARQASYSPITEEQIQKSVISSARTYGIDLPPNQVKVKKGQWTVDIAADYTIPVDLLLRQVELHFQPSASNSQITR